MKTIRLDEYNAIPAVREVAIAEPGPGEVLVRVTAAALNPLDVKLQRGYMHQFFPLTFPSAIGTDLSGVIERTGSLATRWRAGDKVIARLDPSVGGAFGEFALVPSDQLVRAPVSASLEDAAGIPTAAATAWQALIEMAELKPGQTVLIHAGAGGVGSFAIQFARLAGARVVATASGTGIDIVRRLGADQVIDYRSEDFAEKLSDIDVVLDTIGGETQQRSYRVLRAGGKLLAVAAPPDETLGKVHNISAQFVFHASDAGRLGQVVKILDDKGLEVLVDRKVPLEQFLEAFECQASGRARGKIIVTMR